MKLKSLEIIGKIVEVYFEEYPNHKILFDTIHLDLFNKNVWKFHKISENYFYLCLSAYSSFHRLILPKKEGFIIDHINKDPLDNRLCNLRYCLMKENTRNQRKHKNNTSGFPGVSWKKDKNKWKAFLMLDRKQIHLGYFEDKNKAIQARKDGELKYFKEFAPNQ